MTTNQRLCPICNELLGKDDEATRHFESWHPLFFPREMSLEVFHFDFLPNFYIHLLRVLNGSEQLNSMYERYIVRNAADHVRYAAQRSSRGDIVLNTGITSVNSPASNITYATRKKRRS